MTEDTIPVPAESIRQLAIAATEEVNRKRAKGYDASADRLERHLAEVFDSLDGKDGEFVSLNEMVVSGVTAAGTSGAISHANAAEVFLKKYDVWGDE